MTSPLPTRSDSDALIEALAAKDLFLFATLAFSIIEPGRTFAPSWHIDHICFLVTEVYEGRERRVVINVPPRSLKSILISVIFVAFAMGNDPSLKFIIASHNRELSRKLASDFRRLVSSTFFKRVFPRFKLSGDGRRIMEQKTTLNGHRIATSVGGSIMGHGGDIIIVDDPNRAKDIHSETHRNKVHTYFDQELSSRLNDKTRGRIIVVMQRLHEDDLAGHVLSRGTHWTHSAIQAVAEEPRSYRIGYGPNDIKIPAIGDILLPEMNTVESLEEVRATTGSTNFQAQYQQNPTPAEGVVIKREWLRFYDTPPEEFDLIAASWDTASTVEEESDFSACTVWGLRNKYFYLLEAIRGRYESPDLVRLLVATHERYRADVTLIERAGIGFALGAEMRRSSKIMPIMPAATTDKLARLLAQSPKFEAGQVMLPREAPWLGLYLNELLAFPQGKNDDQVDSTSQALKYLSTKIRPPARVPKPERSKQRPAGSGWTRRKPPSAAIR